MPESKDETLKSARRKFTIGRLIKWGIIFYVVSLFVPIEPPLGFIGGIVNNLYFWKNPGRGGAAVAVRRELFLDTADYNRTPEYYDPKYQNSDYAREKIKSLKWCQPGHVRKLEPGEPLPCFDAYANTNSHCSAWLDDFSCNGVAVSSSLWRDNTLRVRIIESALRPCQYLYDPGTGVVKDTALRSGETKFGTVTYPYHALVATWIGSACQTHRALLHPNLKLPIFKPENDTKTIFISIIDENSNPTSRSGEVLAVYKATRKGDVIRGGYIQGSFEGK